MNGRRSEERLYTAIVLAFLIGLVALGLLGIPALLVAAIGAVVAAVGIALFQRSLGRRSGLTPTGRGGRQKVPERYVPSVLEGSSMKRRRIVHLRRHRNASPPLRFR
ncbi:MAG TPA: hypothetical protein VH299_11160 [Solirubrobacterales bacterium]|jgi:hypothetical protein|nr:hypothetical protein [Solirubrobacterales bacterium]